MICPKCGTEQPDGAECVRCGVLVAQYQGPALGAAAFRPSGSQPLASGTEPMRVAHPPSFTGQSAGGTVYGGPPPETMALPPSAFKDTFGFGELLLETFSVYVSNFVPFALLAALAVSPVYLLRYFMITTMKPGISTASLPLSALLVVVNLLAPQIATAAITFGVFQQLRGKETSIAECLKRGVSLLLPVFGLAIVQTLAIALGALVCIVPGIIVAVCWAVSIPAAVTEGTGVAASIERSTFLTDGLRMDIFGVLFALGALQIGLTLLIMRVAVGNASLHLLLLGLKDLLVVGLSATASAVLYYRLRGIKESIDVDQIASVFA